ncbi:oligoendopeptidase F [Candidatus Chloroploca sp. M-50]|uniref:Oligopeptidase F n=1 Tax=Candidatus Chloroploca mongolica TaxID=2528176 RepID=A0ABS4D7G2_9CHLR|nr:oligoendopeptidase F [Candidatus Chloroploca mongolica]MBP1465372.1 oligoendopeptidase F [Candidatus Chloroploca mongolica]
MSIDTHKVPTRSEAITEYTWDLSIVFGDVETWERELAAIEELARKVASFQGSLGQSGEHLAEVLQLRDEAAQRIYALYVYAMHRKDSDATDPVGQALQERAGSFAARVMASMAYVEPEILTIPEEVLAGWVAETETLKMYAYEFEKLNRQRAHIRSAEVEGVLAQFSDVTRAPYEVFEMLSDSDLTFPSITDENGATVQLSHARYGRFLESNHRQVRHDAFKSYYGAYRPFRNTMATTLGASIRTHVLDARIRNYSSALASALDPNEIPLEVYHNLLATVEANLGLNHRYMEIRKRLMGLDELRIYDLYAQPVPTPELIVPYDEAREMMLAAFAPLGDEYAAALQKAFGSRWIDVYENVGKRSGAYSGGSYSTPPYVLLNYQDRLNDAFTLAHELGHSMHSFFSRRNQPFVYGGYTIFVAEVASTLNEALLTDYLLKHRDDEQLRRMLLVQQIEDIRRTIIRQTMFASFELDMHTRVEAGEPLTSDGLSKRYYDLVARYHGPAVTLDDEIAFEWMRIPHFYYKFYVYQYATGLSAALALSRQLMSEGAPAVERYLGFLRGGSSRSPIELLRGAGVDMATPAPVQAAMETFGLLLEQLEQMDGA